MISSRTKALVTVSALLLVTSIVAVGCGQQSTKNAWVGTDTLPGKTFTNNASSNAKRSSSTIVYLGSSNESQDANFGPRDVNFDFQALR